MARKRARFRGHSSEEESHEHSESNGGNEERQDEEDERNQDEEEQEMQIDQELAAPDGDEEGAQDEEDEQVDQERQMHSESDGQEEENEQVVVPKSSSEPVLDPPPSKSTALPNMSLDENMLDCGVCCFPLKPPIFQCAVGHVVCSSCRDKLAAEGRCHVCRTFITGGYHRCHAMEQLVDSVHGSCPIGCAARVRYYDLRDHLRACPHAIHCPAEACDFVGSTAELIHHLVGTHNWPCITGVQNSEVRVTDLHYGFNFMVVVHEARDYIFLLRVVRLIHSGRAISCLCLHPQVAADDSSPSPSKNVSCKLQLFYFPERYKRSVMLSLLRDRNIKVACTNLSNGMPKLRDCDQAMVCDYFPLKTPDTLKVNVSFTIR